MAKAKLTIGEINGILAAAETLGEIFGKGSLGNEMPQIKDVVHGLTKFNDSKVRNDLNLARAIGAINRAAKKLREIEVTVG